jgi:hypothetical protein
MRLAIGAVRAWDAALAALLLAGVPALGAAQTDQDAGVRRPDRWFVTHSIDEQTREATPRMLYLGRDGTVLIVQCAARDGRKTGGWASPVRRDDWMFPTDFLQGWWSVDSEPPVGPLDWGGVGVMVLLNDEALKARLQQPVAEGIVLRVAQGTRQWELEFASRDLAVSVERFAPACQVA